MAERRNHSTLSLASSSSGKIKISSASLSASAFPGGEKPACGLGGGGTRERDHTDGGGGGSGGGGGREYEISDWDRERSRSEGFSSRDLARDSNNNSSSHFHHHHHHHLVRDGGRDVNGGRDQARDGGRDAGGRDAGGRDTGRDIGREYRSRGLPRDDLFAKDSSREGAGGAYGKEKDRSDRIRDWEPTERGREKVDRERERVKRERDLSGSSSIRHQQRRQVGGECPEGGDLLFGRSPSLTSGGSVRQSVVQDSVSSANDGILDKEKNNIGEMRSLGLKLSAKEVDREPGELPNGRRVEEISWRPDVSISMSMHSRNVRNKSSLIEAVGGGKRSPPKKRKFSPIVWDYDEKQARPSSKVSSSITGASSLSISVSKFSGAQPFHASMVQSSASVQFFSSLAACHDNLSPPFKPSSSGQRTPPGLLGAHGLHDLSVSPQESEQSPVSEQIRVSPSNIETIGKENIRDMHMQDQVPASSTSDDEPEPGQLIPESEQSVRMDSPMRIEEDEKNAPPPITIAASRWAGETNTPGRENSPRVGAAKVRNRSSSLDSDEGHVSSGEEVGHLTSGHSTSPEPGEYIQEKAAIVPRSKERVVDSDGSVGKGSNSKCHRSQSFEDEEYERELNKRELMELDEEDTDDQEEQMPEVDPEFDDVPPTPSGPILRAIDMLQGCRSVDEFERLNRIDEGTYGVVYRARNKKTGEIVALKKVKMEKEKEGFPLTSLREINVLLSFHHPSVVDVKEVVVGSTIDSIFMVMEYMEHDLKGLMETMKQPFSQSEVKCLMLQLFEGVKYLHDNWVLHRDLKTSNLLLNNRGELKICDFGLARQYGSPLKAYTNMVVTLWYRAPELLLGSKNYQYSTAIDMWSLGCIMAEFLAKEPLFNGKSEIDQIDKIFRTLGTPNEKIWPEFVKLPGVKCHFKSQPYNRLRERFPPTAFAGRPTLSENGFDLLNRLLTYDPQKRISADEALKHDWFREVPLPKSKEFMPTFPARSEHDRRVRRLMKSPDPLEEQRKRELRQGELGGGGLFG